MSTDPGPDPSRALALFAVRAGPRIGEEILVPRPVATIGRGGQNDVVLDDDSISTTHARLEYDAGSWRITDLQSTNGTYVEGVRLAPDVPTPLHYGASVRLGGVQTHFRPVPEADPEAARAGYVPPQEAPPARRGGFRLPVWVVVLVLVLLVLAIFLYGWMITPEPDPATAPALGSAALALPGGTPPAAPLR